MEVRFVKVDLVILVQRECVKSLNASPDEFVHKNNCGLGEKCGSYSSVLKYNWPWQDR